MFFKDEEDRKRFHQSLLRDHKRNIKFIESTIENYKRLVEVYKGSIYPGNKEMVKFQAAQVKKWETDLQEAKEKQIKAVEKYEARYLTIQEKAVKRGLTVISGGLCENV